MKIVMRYALILLSPYILLFTIECGAFVFNIFSKKNNHYPLLYNPQKVNFLMDGEFKAFNYIDPLLGWAVHPGELKERGYESRVNSIFLKPNSQSNNEVLRVYITGGSTTDLMVYEENWPRYFQEKLAEEGVSSEIYIGAVGGYHSGQELLKTIRDIRQIKPDIHISYSGANEMEHTSYVTSYENSLFHQLLNGPRRAILPNTFECIDSWLNPYAASNRLQENPIMDGPLFWENNMKVMQSLAAMNGYTFYGILQPVFDYENYQYKSTDMMDLSYYKELYTEFFPQAEKRAAVHPFLYDFSGIFTASDELVFRDDCHLTTAVYQKQLAGRVYELVDSSFLKNEFPKNN